MDEEVTTLDSLKGIGYISKNAGLSGMGEIIAMIFTFITGIMIAHIVGAEIYGVFALANTVISVLMVFALFGLSNGVVRYVSFYCAKDDRARVKGTVLTALMISLILSIFFSSIAFLFAKTIAIRIFHDINVTIAIRILAFSMPFLVLNSISTSAMRGFQAIKEYVFIEYILKSVAKFIFLAILFLIGLRLMGLLLAIVVNSFLIAGIALLILLKIFPFVNTNIKAVFQTRELISFSWPLFFTNFLGFVIHWTDILMLGFFLNSIEVGIYYVVHRLMPFIVLPLKSFDVVFAPLISDLHTKGDLKMLESHFKLITKWVFTICFPISILFILFPEAMLRIFGDEFVLGAVPLILITLGELVNASTGSCGHIVVMTGRSRLCLFNALVSAGLNVILNYLWIPKYGMSGAALATATALAVINLMRVAEIYYLMRIHPYSIKMVKPLGIGLFCMIFFYLLKDKFLYILKLNRFGIIVPSFLFIILYSTLLYLMKLDKEDLFVIRKIAQRFTIR